MLDLLLESALRSLALGGAVWLGLRLLHVRNPRVHMTAWTVVLAASLSMPVLMHRLTLTVPAAAPQLHVLEVLPRFSGPHLEATGVPPVPAQDPLVLPAAAEPGVVPPPREAASVAPGWRGPGWPSFDWPAVATAIYLLGAGALLLRLFTGVRLSWRISRAARPIHEDWAGHADVRVSDAVGVPVTFGSTILLPAEYVDWSDAKRKAVLSHEGSHVAHGDFYVLLLATFNRAVFWFSPFAWWQLVRLTQLAEIISDDAALETLDDRPSYAGILLDVAGGLQRAPVAVAMARACTVRERVERILAETAVSSRMSWRKRALVVTALAPAVVISGGVIAFSTSRPLAESAAVVTEATHIDAAVATAEASPERAAEPARPRAAFDGDPSPFDSYVGYYQLPALRALAVTREGDRLLLQETGRPKFEVIARSDGEFISTDASTFVTFKSEAPGRTELLLREPGWAARRAVRIDAERAQAIENAFAHQIAAAPDRFRDQVPLDGSKAALLRVIEELQRGDPRYERMSERLADAVRRQLSQLQQMLTAVGAIESVFFRGVGPGGFDIYGAKFAGGFAEFRILVDADGSIEDLLYRPNGDDTPGGILACPQEPALKSLLRTPPIRLVLYNSSGAEVRVIEIDSEGKRSRTVTIGDERSASILTYVGHPWIVADAAGQCADIIMTGQSTRYLTITPKGHAQTVRSAPAPRRASPMAGSEQALRQYIDAVGRGEPNYDDMTPEVAAETRHQLMLDRAILAKLGALRAMSFRGVTQLDSDIYIVHFANGSAEWRIGLVKQGRIGRIALGPQY